ncbi:hypothetical protein BX600DRAFT_440301 [Xylariales sp. PMI_506]|nr:hypothetical protein BX600DRAFT_440301 [Xylariales sp. PMI_506]
MSLTVEELKSRGLEIMNLLGNQHDTSSARILDLLHEDCTVQHGHQPPSEGGRKEFLTTFAERLSQIEGQFSLVIKHVIAEVYGDGGAEGGQCWIYATKSRQGKVFDGIDMLTFNADGRVIHCKDLHGPAQGRN